ncbi:MAG: 4-hydroxy-tetrahydrodipicolinate reductase [Acidimicrobiia bacterium]|nr:4-hydroxy-tetrahydrodipicolinate reductase [Acidimicrobiia bacterium]
MRVGISGAPGRMGRLTIGVVEKLDGFTVGGLFAPGHDDEDVRGHVCSGAPDALADSDVIVEFTTPDAADENVGRWREMGCHVLVGTSGYTVEKLAVLRETWPVEGPRCLVVPNFAIGAVLMMRFAELAAPHFGSAEVIEMHHRDKPDAPSGTALATAARMAAARDRGLEGTPSRGSEIISGALGADVDGVPVHSLRVEGSIAHQEVVLGTVGQYLTIRHDTTDYSAFAPGITLALRHIATLTEPVTVGLEALLGV